MFFLDMMYTEQLLVLVPCCPALMIIMCAAIHSVHLPICSSRVPSPKPVLLKKNQEQLTRRHPRLFSNGTGHTSVSTKKFLAQIGKRLTEMTMDPHETALLFQCFSVAAQCSNVACL